MLWGWRDMGAEEQGWGSGEMGKECGKFLEFWSHSWDCGLVAGPGWGDYAENRANHGDQAGDKKAACGVACGVGIG